MRWGACAAGSADRGLAGGRVRRTSRDAARAGAGGRLVSGSPSASHRRWSRTASVGTALVLPGVDYAGAPLLEYAGRAAGGRLGLRTCGGTTRRASRRVDRGQAGPRWRRRRRTGAGRRQVAGDVRGRVRRGTIVPAIWLTPLLAEPRSSRASARTRPASCWSEGRGRPLGRRRRRIPGLRPVRRTPDRRRRPRDAGRRRPGPLGRDPGRGHPGDGAVPRVLSPSFGSFLPLRGGCNRH